MERAVSTSPGLASLPNVLTYLRILAVPAVVLILFLVPGHAGRWWALAVYIGACVTDWLDGFLARVWRQQSTLGRMLDPIADKLLVGTTLLMLTYDGTLNGQAAFAAAEFLMDYLKTQAPFWKKEAGPHGEGWVEARASDEAAAQRWKSD